MRVRVLIALAVATVALMCVAGSASAHGTAKLPPPLVGAWARFVTASDWGRVGIATEPPAHFSMLVSADGSVIVAESSAVRFTALPGNRVRISGVYDCGKKTGLYTWSVVGRRLRFTKLQDTCNYSLALYNGAIWTREKV